AQPPKAVSPTGDETSATAAAPVQTAANQSAAPANALASALTTTNSASAHADSKTSNDAALQDPTADVSPSATLPTGIDPTTQVANLAVTNQATGTANSPANVIQTSDAVSAAVPITGLAVAIATRAQAGKNRFEIRLDPPELGRIDVKLDVDRSGNVTSRLVVDKPETLNLLRTNAPQLERALQDAGLKTGDNGLQFSLRDQSSGGQNQANQNNNNGASAFTRVVVPDEDLPSTGAIRGYGRFLGANGGVDIRV